MEPALTNRQAQIVDFIRVELETQHRSPSLREIGAHMGISAPSVEDHLDAIEAKGYICREPGKRRNIRLTADALRLPRPTMLPLLGRVAAGLPLLAPANVSEWCAIAPTLFRPHANFLMRVDGDSMNDAGIANGDLVAIHRQDTANNGQIVMCVLPEPLTGEHQVTLKRLRVEAHRYLLLSENRQANYPPIVVDRKTTEESGSGLQISGIYCGHLHLGVGGNV